MTRGIYVNLPVRDLKRTVDFWTKLDFKFNLDFTDDKATCMIINPDAYIMFLVEPFFKEFIGNKVIGDSDISSEVIVCISAENKEQVNRLIEMAVAQGATTVNEPQDYGWMYSWGFQDLDGHLWEVAFMDEAAIPKE